MIIEGEINGDHSDRLIFAYYVTGHGFGHATRVTEVHFLPTTFLFRFRSGLEFESMFSEFNL